MQLARELGMTLRQLFENADSRELGLWIALYDQENKEASLQNLAARAEANRKKR